MPDSEWSLDGSAFRTTVGWSTDRTLQVPVSNWLATGADDGMSCEELYIVRWIIYQNVQISLTSGAPALLFGRANAMLVHRHQTRSIVENVSLIDLLPVVPLMWNIRMPSSNNTSTLQDCNNWLHNVATLHTFSWLNLWVVSHTPGDKLIPIHLLSVCFRSDNWIGGNGDWWLWWILCALTSPLTSMFVDNIMSSCCGVQVSYFT